MSKKLETEGFDFDDGLDFDFEADIDGALNQSNVSKKRDRSVTSSVIDGAIEGAKDTLKSPAFYRETLRKSLPHTYGEIADGVSEVASGSYKILDDSVKELKPRLGSIVNKLDKLVPENQKTLKAISERLKKLTGVDEGREYAGTENQEEQLVNSTLAAIFEQNKQYTQIAERKQLVRDAVGGKYHDQSIKVLTSIDQSTKTSALYTTNVTQAFQKKTLELQLRTFTMQRDYYTKSINYQEAFKNQLEGIIKNTAMPEYLKITKSERFMERASKKMLDKLYSQDGALARGMGKLRERVGNMVSGASYALENFDFALDTAASAREQLESMNEMLASMGEPPLTKEQMLAAAASSAALAKARDFVTDKIRGRTEKMGPLKEKLARGARAVLNPGAELKKFQGSEKWQNAINDYQGIRGAAARFMDGFLDVFSDESPERKVRSGGNLRKLSEPTMGFDNRAHISLVDIIPGHLAAIRREISILRTGDTSTPLTVYDFQKRSFVDQKTMDRRVSDKVTAASMSGMLNWELQNAGKTMSAGKELDKDQEANLQVFITRLSRVNDLSFEPDEIRETDVYQSLDPDTRKIVDLYLDSIETSNEKQQKILELSKRVDRVRKSLPSASEEIQGFMDSGHVESLRKMGLLKEDEDGNITIDEDKFAEIQDNMVRATARRYGSDINIKEAIKKMEPEELIKSVNSRFKDVKISGKLGKNPRDLYKGLQNTDLFSWSYKAGEGTPGVKNGPMAQDVRRNLGEAVAPDGKSIDIQSMNGALMAAVKHVGGRVDDLYGEGKTDGKKSVMHEMRDGIHELVSLVKDIGEVVRSSPGGTGAGAGGRAVDGSYSGLAGALTSSVVSLATKVSGDIFAAAGKTYSFGKDEFVKPLAGFLSKSYKDNKDPVATGIKNLFSKATDLAGNVLDFTGKTLTDYLPRGLKSLRDMATGAWKSIKEFFNETKDLYLPDGTEPVIRAVKLRMGAYRDAATGRVIKTMDELLECKNDIVDSAGNIVLTLEEKVDGLYDKHGEKVKSFATNMIHGAIGAAMWVGDKAKTGIKNLMEAGKGGLDGVKKMFSNKFKGFSDFEGFGGGKYVKSSYEVLVDIRDIMLGKGKSVSDRLAADIGPKLPGVPGSGTPGATTGARAGGSLSGSLKSVENLVESGKNGFGMVRDFAMKREWGEKFQNLKNKVFGSGEKPPEMVGPAPEMVGPRLPETMGPPKPVQTSQPSLISKFTGFLKNSVKGKESVPEMAGPAPELVGPVKPEAPKKGFMNTLKSELSIIGDGAKDAYGEVKKHVMESEGKEKVQAAGQTVAGSIQAALKPLLDKLSGTGAKQPDSGERKGSVAEREAKIEQMHQARQHGPAELNQEVMNGKAPDMMDGVKNGILGAKLLTKGLGIAKGVGGRMLGRTAFGRKIMSKFGKKDEQPAEEEVEDQNPEEEVKDQKPEEAPEGDQKAKNDPKNRKGKKGRKGKKDKKEKADTKPEAKDGEGESKEPDKKKGIWYNPLTKLTTALDDVSGKNKKFNDKDEDGDRDGGVKDREEKMKALEESRKKDPAKLPEDKKKKDGMSGLLSGLGSLIGMLGTGFGKVFGLLKGGFGKVFKIVGKGFGLAGRAITGVIGLAGKVFGALKSPGGLIKGAGKLIGTAGRALGTAGRFALTRALPAVAGLAIKGLGAAASGIASVVGSPVVLGAAAIAAVGYGIYKGYKYYTRNDLDEYDRIRVRQYGFGYDNLVDEHNHKFLGLEEYLYDGRLKFDAGGRASIADKTVKMEELLDIMKIDPEDKEMVERFTTWFGERFKPFFLHHATTLFAIDQKLKLKDIKSKLKPDQKLKYLETAGFTSGPYDVKASPIKTVDEAKNDKDAIVSSVDNLSKSVVEEAKKKVEEYKDPFRLTPTTKQSEADNKKLEKVVKDQETKPTEQSPGDQAKKAAENAGAGATGEDGPKPDTPATTAPEKTSDMAKSVKTAPGGILDGSGGREFVKLGRGMTDKHLEGLHPGVLKLFLGMAQEYGQLTGKSIQMNEGVRTYAEQAALREKYGNRAAKPGTSLHESGLAIDIPAGVAAELEKLGLMRKYGFTRPVGGEPWHMEPAGIQRNVRLARDDKKHADLMVETSLYRGGGGYGTMADAKKYGRNQQLAVALLDKEPEIQQASNTKSEDEAMQRDVKDVAKAADDIVANKDGSKAVVSEEGSKTKDLPPPKEAQPQQVAEAPTMKEGVGSGQGKGGGAGGVPGEAEAPPASTGSTPISGRGDSNIKSIITEAAKKVGIDPKTLLTFAAVESDMRPNAKASTSSAAGLFQFVSGTWKSVLSKFGRKHGLGPDASPLDPKASSLMAAEYLKENGRGLATVKPNPGPTDLYLTHFLGPGGAKKFLSMSPDQPAAEMMPKAAQSNANIFYDKNRQARPMKAVYSTLDDKLRKKSAMYGIDLPASGPTGPAANDSFATKAAEAPTAPAFGTTGPVTPPPEVPATAKFGTVGNEAPVEKKEDTGVLTVGEEKTPVLSGETKEPIITDGGGVFLDPQGGSRQARELRSRDPSDISSSMSSVETTLKSSLDVQRDTLTVLQGIAKSIDPEAWAKVIGGMSGKKEEGESNTLKQADQRNLDSYKRDQRPTLDLNRRAA